MTFEMKKLSELRTEETLIVFFFRWCLYIKWCNSLSCYSTSLTDLEALSKEEEFSGLHFLQSHGPAGDAVSPL